jgi:hypothetical protein
MWGQRYLILSINPPKSEITTPRDETALQWAVVFLMLATNPILFVRRAMSRAWYL